LSRLLRELIVNIWVGMEVTVGCTGLSAVTAQSSGAGPGANVDKVRMEAGGSRHMGCPHCSAGAHRAWAGDGASFLGGRDRAGGCVAPPGGCTVRFQLRYGRGYLVGTNGALVVVVGLLRTRPPVRLKARNRGQRCVVVTVSAKYCF
jgi:hypothetical protein